MKRAVFGLILAVSTAFVPIACDRDRGPTPPSERSPSAGGSDATPDHTPRLFDSGLRMDTITGLQEPTQMVFLGPQDLLVSEKASGKIVRVQDGVVQTEPVARLAANVADERGILGLALHPAFSENHFVYVYWTWSGGEAEAGNLFGPPSTDIEDVPPLGNRVDRFVWDGVKLVFDRNIIQLPSRTTDLTLDRRRGNHNGGVIAFGPDGKLYVVIGDQNDRGPLQNVRGSDSRSGIDGLTGIVLRLNDDGTTPLDNPFVGAVDDLALENVFLYGVGNSYGFDWDPASGSFWMETNGQASYDELGRYEAGDNLGWIQIMGPPDRFNDYRSLEAASDRQLDTPGFLPSMLAGSALEAISRLVMIGSAPYRPPLFSWKASVAPTALCFLDNAHLGNGYPADLLVGDATTGSIYRFKLTPDRQDLALSDDLSDRVNDNSSDSVGELGDQLFGSGFFVTTDIEVAPDGAVWVASLTNNALYRITATPQGSG